MGRAAEVVATSSSIRTDGGCPVAQVNDLSRSLTAFDPAGEDGPTGCIAAICSSMESGGAVIISCVRRMYEALPRIRRD